MNRDTGDSSKIRVCIVAPSLDILGGQSRQAVRLLTGLNREPTLAVDFIPHNPRLPGVLRELQSIKYVRTAVTTLFYCGILLARLRRYDVVQVFSAAYYSYLLSALPAVLIAKLYGKPIILNYRSGEAEDHLRRAVVQNRSRLDLRVHGRPVQSGIREVLRVPRQCGSLLT